MKTIQILVAVFLLPNVPSFSYAGCEPSKALVERLFPSAQEQAVHAFGKLSGLLKDSSRPVLPGGYGVLEQIKNLDFNNASAANVLGTLELSDQMIYKVIELAFNPNHKNGELEQGLMSIRDDLESIRMDESRYTRVNAGVEAFLGRVLPNMDHDMEQGDLDGQTLRAQILIGFRDLYGRGLEHSYNRFLEKATGVQRVREAGVLEDTRRQADSLQHS